MESPIAKLLAELARSGRITTIEAVAIQAAVLFAARMPESFSDVYGTASLAAVNTLTD